MGLKSQVGKKSTSCKQRVYHDLIQKKEGKERRKEIRENEGKR